MANSELNLGRWRDVFQGLEIRDQPGHLIRPPDAEELGHFEAESGIRLPDGYRDFLLRFGTGLLLVDGREITISSPTCPRSGFYFTKHLPDSSGTADPSIPEIVPRLIHFASTQLGDRFAWDPENPSDLSAPEFAIYAMIYKENEPVRVADNFEGFLRFCLDPPTFDSVLHLPPVADEFDGLDDSIIHMRYYLREICESYVFLH